MQPIVNVLQKMGWDDDTWCRIAEHGPTIEQQAAIAAKAGGTPADFTDHEFRLIDMVARTRRSAVRARTKRAKRAPRGSNVRQLRKAWYGTVAPETQTYIKHLAASQQVSESRVIDEAVALLWASKLPKPPAPINPVP